MHGARFAAASSIGLATVLTTSLGLADKPEKAPAPASANGAAAQELFDQARTLMAASKFAEAYPKLVESQRLDPGMGTEFNLADCEEHLGKSASAWAHYLDVADAAKIAGQAARQRVARTRAAALEAHLARLRVNVAAANGQSAQMEIRRDGLVVGAGQYGVALPIDPGEHHLTATAPGKRDWARDVKTPPDATSVVDVPALEDAPAPAVATATATAPAAPQGPSHEDLDRASRARTQRVAGITVAAAGVVGIGIGAAFGFVSKGKHDDADPHCGGGGGGGDSCDATGVALRNDAIHAGNVSTIAFIAGGAALVGGGILFFTAPKTKESDGQSSGASSARASLSAAPILAPGTGGFALSGRF